MIGAHDTFTYLNAQDAAVNLFKKYWRCQVYNITTLYSKYNVRFFDIRLCKNTTAGLTTLLGKLFKKKKFTWATAHGLAEFKQEFTTIEDVFKFMQKNVPLAQYRIVLERCSKEEVKEFKSQIDKWISKNGQKLKSMKYNCSWIGIKNPWTVLYIDKDIYPAIIDDRCCRLFNWDVSKSLLQNIKNFKAKYTIERWAKDHNPVLNNTQINDKRICYFMDYIGRYGVR